MRDVLAKWSVIVIGLNRVGSGSRMRNLRAGRVAGILSNIGAKKRRRKMKGILEFDLPADNDAFKLCQRGSAYFSFLFDLDQTLRDWLKYKHQFNSPEEVMEKIREMIAEGVEIQDIE